MNTRTRNSETARRRARGAVLAAGACSLGILVAPVTQADDGGKSVYLLGKRGPLAAFVPKPGFYLSNDVYSYDASSSDLLPLGDRLGDHVVQDVSAQALMDIPQFTWVTDFTVAGGRLAFSALIPFGKVDVTGKGTAQLPGGPGPSVKLLGLRQWFRGPGGRRLHRLEASRRRQVPGMERLLVGLDSDRFLPGRAARQPEQQSLGARRRRCLYHGQLQGWPRVLVGAGRHLQRRQPGHRLQQRHRLPPGNVRPAAPAAQLDGRRRRLLVPAVDRRQQRPGRPRRLQGQGLRNGPEIAYQFPGKVHPVGSTCAGITNSAPRSASRATACSSRCRCRSASSHLADDEDSTTEEAQQ